MSPDANLMQDLGEARRIQMSMLPQTVPQFQGFEMAAHCTPAAAVGGDFYDFIQLGQDRLGVVVGDAVGHGIAAALLMTMTLTDFRSIALREASAAAVLNSVNRRLTQGMRSRVFVTSVYAVLDRANHRLTCAMGGQQPWVVKAKTGRCQPIEPPGSRFPLGASQKSVYQTCDLELETGDLLVCFTDGIPESLNAKDETYGFGRLERVLIQHRHADAGSVVEAVLSDVRQFADGRTPEDDMTLVVMKATESFVAAPTLRPSQLIAGEQKTVTALFAVASAELPNALTHQIRSVMKEYGGVVDAMGEDMVVAIFGAPKVHEDDAERAIAAARKLQAIETDLTFRVGINTGTATVRTEMLSYRELGETLYDALHLANAAQPGQILVGHRTRELASGVFTFSPAAVTIDATTSTAHVVEATAESPRLRAEHQGLRAPLTGRDGEMETLTACLDDLMDGRGGIVSISGEAGIGKSRLVAEFRSRAEASDAQWLEGRCVSYGQAVGYSPFQGIIGSYLGITPTNTEAEMKAKLEARVNALLPAEHKWHPIHVGQVFFPQYEAVLRTASGDDYAKQRTFPVMRNLFERIADQKPLVMLVDDLHWADPSSLALLEYLMENVDEAPILYLWVYRPERDSGCWRLRERAVRDYAYCHTAIDLTPLGEDATTSLIAGLLQTTDLSPQMRQAIQQKAAGNPLYVEELLRSLINLPHPTSPWQGEESVPLLTKEGLGEVSVPLLGGVRDSAGWVASGERFTPSDTLQGVILARVDSLEPEPKEVLQVASVVGDTFALPLLEQVTKSPPHLSRSLRELERAEMLQRRRVGREWEYRFRHPLILDVVYHSLLDEDRAVLHERTGATIETLYADKLDTYTNELARHYGKGNNIDKALHYLTLAGDKAAELKSYWEALDWYGQAMKVAEGLTDERRMKEMVVDLVRKRSGCRHMLGALKPDIEELEKYVGWVEEIGDRTSRAYFYLRLTSHRGWQGERIADAEKYYKRWADMGGDEWEHVEQVFGHCAQRARTSYDHLLDGLYEGAIALDKQIVEAAERKNDVHSFCNGSRRLAKAYRTLGRWGEAFEACQVIADFANKHNLSARIIEGHYEHGTTYLHLGEWERAIEACEIALSMSPSGLAMPWVVTPLGDAYCKSGQLDKGLNFLEHWKADAKRVGRGTIVECEYCLPLAEGYFAKGDVDKALANAEEALGIALEQGYPLHEAQAYRILGEILASTDLPAAEEHFARSLAIMQRIKARNEEGKTELSCGRACKAHGDIDGARTHLTRAAEIFEALGTERYLEWTQEGLAGLEPPSGLIQKEQNKGEQ